MHAAEWIAVIFGIIGGGGAGGGALKIVSTLTRLIVAIEAAADAIKEVVNDVKELRGQLAAQATDIAVLKSQQPKP